MWYLSIRPMVTQPFGASRPDGLSPLPAGLSLPPLGASGALAAGLLSPQPMLVAAKNAAKTAKEISLFITMPFSLAEATCVGL